MEGIIYYIDVKGTYHGCYSNIFDILYLIYIYIYNIKYIEIQCYSYICSIYIYVIYIYIIVYIYIYTTYIAITYGRYFNILDIYINIFGLLLLDIYI